MREIFTHFLRIPSEFFLHYSPRQRMAGGEEYSERHCSGSAAQDERERLISPVLDNRSTKVKSYPIISRCFFLSICMEISNVLVTIPLNQILESIICHRTFSDLSNDTDPRCKDENVQRELSFIRGWQLTFDVIPGLLTAMLYGLAAKRCGRQLILALSVSGGTLAAGFVIFICILESFILIASLNSIIIPGTDPGHRFFPGRLLATARVAIVCFLVRWGRRARVHGHELCFTK